VYGLVTLNGLWLAGAGAHFVLMTAWLMYVYSWSGNPMRNALMAPISGAMIFAILVYSLRKCQTGRITWRDTVFSAPSSNPQRQ